MNKILILIISIVIFLFCFEKVFSQNNSYQSIKKYCYDSLEVLKIIKKFDECDYLKLQNKDLSNQNDTLKLYNSDLKKVIIEKDKKLISLNEIINMQSNHITELEFKPVLTIVEKRPWYEIPAFTAAGIAAGMLITFLIK